MYSTTQTYLYIKKRTLCKKKNQNSLVNPNRTLNLQGVPTLELNNVSPIPPTCPTNIMPILPAPFFEVYTIDPSGSLFGKSPYPCNKNAWEKYLVYSCDKS